MATLDELLAAQMPSENDVLADNPWYMAGRQIQGMQAPQAQNNTQAFLLPLIQGLAGGGLMGLGKDQAFKSAYDQYSSNPLLKAMVAPQPGVINDEAGNPIASTISSMSPYGNEAMPEGWTPKVGKADLLQALAAKQITDEAAAKKADFESQVDAQIRLKTDPRILAAEGLKTSADIEKDKAKNLREDEKITYDRVTGLDEAKALAAIEPNIKLAAQLVDKTDKASGLAFTKAIIKSLDKTSVISGTEIKVAQDVIPFLEKNLGAQWRSIVKGESELTPKYRRSLLAATMPIYDATGQAYEQKKNEILDVFEKVKGGSRASIPVSTWKPIDLGDGSPPPGMKMQRNKKTGETRFVPL